ncbi:MAG TPA: hypothetical protein VMT68_10885 [Caulobacteraceae bacterium]|nr:hypothetical protein [Caulobacteraceae bacterium]
MSTSTYHRPRTWVKRVRGRRASDRGVRLETVLAIGVILAWAWGIYELTLLYLH